jgi:hypothetical protein
VNGADHVLVTVLEAPLAKLACLAETIVELRASDRPLEPGEIADDLDKRAGIAPRPDAAARVLIVQTPSVRAAFSTTAAVRLVEVPAKAFWRMPRLLREAGCAGWVAGAVELAPAPSGPIELALWLNLPALALELAEDAARA